MSNLRKRLLFCCTRAVAVPAAESIFAALALFWLVIEVGWYYLPKLLNWHSAYLLVLGVVLPLLYAFWRHFPKVSYRVHSKAMKVDIEVRVGDLLDESGHIMIGSNDCFDTELPAIISPKSIQGKFLQKEYNGRHDVLDKHIEDSLAAQGVEGAVDAQKQFGKATRYQTGTVAVLERSRSCVFLSAFAHMQNDRTVQATADGLWDSLMALWESVRLNAQTEPVSIPVLGAGLGRAPASWLSLASLAIISFAMASRERIVARKLSLIVYDGDYDPADFDCLCSFLKKLQF